MSAQFADGRKTERDPGHGMRRRAPFPEGLAPTRARGDPLLDLGGGLHDPARDEQRTPRTEGCARRSAFGGNDGTLGRARVSHCAGAVLNGGRRVRGPSPKPGPLAAAPGTRPANRPRRAPADGRKRLRTRNSRASSDSWATLPEKKTRYTRARIARDSSRYHEQSDGHCGAGPEAG